MISLGELIAYLPIPGGHIKLAERFVDGALSAVSVLVDFCDKNTKLNSLWIIICLFLVVFINFLGAGTTTYPPVSAPHIQVIQARMEKPDLLCFHQDHYNCRPHYP